jgi:flavin-dependent dehydrogenase
MTHDLPIVVIGAGPAGSVASILLSRAGLNVLLIEQHRFPRDKVCGECLSSVGIDVLDRLDITKRLAGFAPAPLRRTLIHASNGSTLHIPLPRPMLGISRLRLDEELLTIALESGTRVMQPARCERLDVQDSPMRRVVVRDLVTNQQHLIDASLVLVADGKAALLPERPKATTDLGIKAHFMSVDGPRDAVELFGVGGYYGGLAPVEDDRWNASFSVPVARVQASSGDLDGLLAGTVVRNRTLRARMRSARRVGPWLASPLPRFGVRRAWPRGVIPLGNAAAAIEPIGGEGIGLAMRSAELAADAIIRFTRGVDCLLDLTRLRAAFAALWRPRRPACRALAVAIASEALANWAVPMIAASDLPARLGRQLIGK